KLDTIVGGFRSNARRVYEGIADLPGLCLRQRPDPEGDTGSYVWIGLPSKDHRDRFMKGMRAENGPAGPPVDAALLPVQPWVEQKLTAHPDWPSFTSPRGRAIRYGAECCPRTLAIHRRFAGVALDPKFSRRDVDDIVAAIRKVHPTAVQA